MSARDEAVEMIRRICPPHLSADEYGQILAEKFDAHRAEILAEAKNEVVAWLVKKAAEGTPVGELASKVDRGAVRIFLGTGHYRDAMDAHRAEVLTEAAEAIDVKQDEYEAQERQRFGHLDHETVLQRDAVRESAALLRQMAAGKQATAAAATAAPNFFVAGRIYRAQNHGDLHFHCLAISPHPETGEPKAFGWRYAANHKQWRGVADLGADDWTCCAWTDTTDTEASRG